MDALAEKNFKALAQGLKDERVKTSALANEVTLLREAIGTLQQQVINLQQQSGIMMAKVQGNGATA